MVIFMEHQKTGGFVTRPEDIEKQSFATITRELGDLVLPDDIAPVVKRVIHTSADFDYVRTLRFSPDAVRLGMEALRNGATIVTDTNMALAGISKPSLSKLGAKAVCLMADPEVAALARERGTTRAVISMIFAIGNAPTALIRLHELTEEGRVSPALVIGVPVGFVNVVESKELFLSSTVPHIIAEGRKGGSNVAAAICNALLYEAVGRKL